MDFVNQSISQVSELFRSMTPGARVTAGLLLAVVVVSLAYLFRQGAAGPDAFLFGGEPLSDGQLTRVEAAIAQAGLSGFQREGNRIRVPAGQQSAYLAAVADAGALPPNFNTILENALDKGGPWESASAQRERLKIAKQQTLGEIVRAMYWVESAVVLYDEHESRNGRGLGTVKKVTASVAVQPNPGETLDPIRAKNLQKLVASSVNMDPKDVNITNLGDSSGYASDGLASLELIENEYLRTKVAFEMQKRESILNALRDIPGVRVQVNAELDDVVEETTRNVKPDPKPATQREVTRTDESIQTTTDGGGRPGVTSQGPNRQAGLDTAERQKQSETKSETTETDNVVGLEENRTIKRGYTPREVWATVTIPSRYVETLWKSRNPDAPEAPKPQDLEILRNQVVTNVENIVEPLLILQANKGENTYKHVRVVVLDSLPLPEIEPPSISTNAMSWAARNWSTAAMLALALMSLLILRGVVKGGPPATSAGASPVPALVVHSEEQGAKEGDSSDEEDADRPRLKLKKTNSLKDDLIEIVREDPDAAADILRSWINKAG